MCKEGGGEGSGLGESWITVMRGDMGVSVP